MPSVKKKKHTKTNQSKQVDLDESDTERNPFRN